MWLPLTKHKFCPAYKLRDSLLFVSRQRGRVSALRAFISALGALISALRALTKANTASLLPSFDTFAQEDVAKTRGNHSGFTLIEMLVSLAIFALIGVSAYQVLASSALVSEREQTRTENMHELDRALRIIERDLRQVVNRPVRDELGSQHALSGSVEGELDFTRGGNDNPLGLARSDLLRVSYSLREPEPDPEKDGDKNNIEQRAESEDTLELLRTLSRMPDASLETPANEQLLLSAVIRFTVRFMDDKLSWHETWPTTQAQGEEEDQVLNGESGDSNRTDSDRKAVLPVAIEVNVLTASTGELSRVISLR